jgi:hypothetical protein
MTSITLNAKNHKKINVMARAWEIAKNSYNAHNGSAQTVAQLGSAISSRDFFSASLKLAWNEFKTNSKIYNTVKSLPSKIILRIHQAIKSLFISKSTSSMNKETANFNMAKTVMCAKNDSKTLSSAMTSKIHAWAYGEQQLNLF